VFCDLVNDSLDEYSYDADIAGLSYNLSPQANGLILNLGGYNDKLPVLLRVVAERIKGFKADPQRFALIVEQVCPFHLGRIVTFKEHSSLEAWKTSDSVSPRTTPTIMSATSPVSGSTCPKRSSRRSRVRRGARSRQESHSVTVLRTGINLESLQSYIDTLLTRFHVQALVHGNIVKDVRIAASC
jgi:insulysin